MKLAHRTAVRHLQHPSEFISGGSSTIRDPYSHILIIQKSFYLAQKLSTKGLILDAAVI